MIQTKSMPCTRVATSRVACVFAAFLTAAIATNGQNGNGKKEFQPNDLLISRTVYSGVTNLTSSLPPNCPLAASKCHKSISLFTPNTKYPFVFNNNLYDGSFGITSPIFLDEYDPRKSEIVNTVAVPTATTGDYMVTSFSSKSELALNRSTDGKLVTFMGYIAAVGAIDVSNSNTPGFGSPNPFIDPTNPVGEEFYRAVAQVDKDGNFTFTLTNAYSGNNGRAAILANDHGNNAIFTAGNAGNGGNPQPDGIIGGTGAQIMSPSALPESAQSPGDPTPVGSFNVTQIPGDSADKAGKDTNFRGLTIFNNVAYFTKGSGGNGIDTVYFIDTTGSACPNGVGLPSPFAVLPTTGIDPTYNWTGSGNTVQPYNMCILKGFSTLFPDANTAVFPFGLFFADANTLYVADEGSGDNTFSNGEYVNAASQTMAGLQKWTFDSVSGSWVYRYTLQAGLNLGVPYSVANYPTGNNAATGLPWSPATDGLRNLTGSVDGNSKATIWAITSTVSGSGDQGADPNMLVTITDSIPNLDPTVAMTESFATLITAGFGEVLRGVSPTPGSHATE